MKNQMIAQSLCFFLVGSAFAGAPTPSISSPDWRQPKTDAQQFQNNSFPIPYKDVVAVRSAIESLPRGYRPESRDVVKLAGGVRTGSGGGGGMACFTNNQDADAAIGMDGRVQSGQENRIARLFVFDALYDGRIRTGFFPVLNAETGSSYLMRILNSEIRRANPQIAQKLAVAIAAVDPSKWLNRSSLPRYNDTGAQNPDGSLQGCPVSRYVQLVVRYERSKSGRLPDIVVDADYALLARMHATQSFEQAVINEALLILHEALYLIAVENGNWASERVRILAGDLLMKSYYYDGSRQKTQEAINQVLTERLKMVFWDFDHFMTDVTASGQGASAALASGSFGALLQEKDQELQNYLQGQMLVSPQVPSAFTIWDMHSMPPKLGPIAKKLMELNPALSFLYSARYTGVRNEPKFHHTVENLYLTASPDRNLFTQFCHSMEIDMGRSQIGQSLAQGRNSGYVKLMAVQDTITQRGLQFCQQNDVPPMTREQRQAFFEWIWKLKTTP